MSFAEDELLPLSALQHLLFCPRQCALIHIEQIWEENLFTTEGKDLHEKADEGETDSRGPLRIARGLMLSCRELGLSGKADVVEFHRIGPPDGEVPDLTTVVTLPGVAGSWKPFPVEYKRGRPKPGKCDVVQLCAQAMCLEEMLSMHIDSGALFYHQPRRRQEVLFDRELRELVRETSARLHELISSGVTPPAVHDQRCKLCSLFSLCMPACTTHTRSVARYIQRGLESGRLNTGGVS
jgi:CRISPR-associated exonuclease Cas4